MKYDGVLFDLDGTLWNATEGIAVAWAEALKRAPDVKQPPSVGELEGVMGMTAKSLVEALFPHLTEERGLALFELCCEEENRYLTAHGGKLYEGVDELLRTLSQKLPLFIVSNCNHGYIQSFLAAHGFAPYFRDYEYIGRTGLEKCDNIQLVVERNHLKSPVYVGDTELDAASAKQAGVPFIHAAYGFGKVNAELRIDRPLGLLELL